MRAARAAALWMLTGLMPAPWAEGQVFPDTATAQAAASSAGSPDAARTLVVFNSRLAESRELARFYAEKRGIPKERLLGLPCAETEEITREEYDKELAEPLRRAFTSNFWWKLRPGETLLGSVESNQIRFIALMRGIPLKIRGVENYRGDNPHGTPPIGNRNDAAVDSELATLGFFTRQISGPLQNPYYRSFLPIAELRHPDFMLVCRLDGPSAAIVRRMILDSLAVEHEGLAGFAYVDARGIAGGNYQEGDDWLKADALSLRRQGFPVIFDNGPELFPEGFPMKQAAMYYGWYTSDVAGPFVRPGFHFVRGAIAVHIHSFSAASVQDPKHFWVGPLLAAGAAATVGNVYEPYLTLTPHLDILQDRLRAGFTFAEAAYMASRTLSWMTTYVGDPLYRPFKGAEVGDDLPRTGEWAVYREAAKQWFSKDRAAGEAALKDAGRKLHSGMIYEGLGLLQGSADDAATAILSFRQARKLYKAADDVTRVALHEMVQLRKAKRDPEALALAKEMLAAFPDASAASIFRDFAKAPGP